MKKSDKTKSIDQLNKVKIKDALKAQYLTSWRESLNKTNKSLTFRQYKTILNPLHTCKVFQTGNIEEQWQNLD